MRYSEMKARENTRDWQQAREAAKLAPPRRSPVSAGVLILLGLIVLALVACTSNAYRNTDVAITTNGPVDLQRYKGLWYEIARFPNRFEEGCVGVTAEYSLSEDGSVRVLNTCVEGTLDGPVSTAEGEATTTSLENDKLSVTFVPWLPFARGDYWILDTDYEVAVIGTPSGSVGWVLARTPTLSKDRLARAFQVLERNGYDLTQITMTQQQ
ncbi:MAG: lipocalin family protein [Pseudomonadota bacterium]